VRSNAYSLVSNREHDDVIAAALERGNFAEAMPTLVDVYASEMAVLEDQDPRTIAEFVANEITMFIKLVGVTWHPEQRKDYNAGITDAFAHVPYSILLPTVQEARRKVYSHERFVSWCFERMEDKLARLNEEYRVLQELIRIANR